MFWATGFLRAWVNILKFWNVNKTLPFYFEKHGFGQEPGKGTRQGTLSQWGALEDWGESDCQNPWERPHAAPSSEGPRQDGSQGTQSKFRLGGTSPKESRWGGEQYRTKSRDRLGKSLNHPHQLDVAGFIWRMAWWPARLQSLPLESHCLRQEEFAGSVHHSDEPHLLTILVVSQGWELSWCLLAAEDFTPECSQSHIEVGAMWMSGAGDWGPRAEIGQEYPCAVPAARRVKSEGESHRTNHFRLCRQRAGCGHAWKIYVYIVPGSYCLRGFWVLGTTRAGVL